MAISRVNLCLRPALKSVGGPTWLLPDGNWVRSTTLHASLPRQTGVSGSADGEVYAAVAPVVPGRTYIGSVSSRAVSAGSGSVALAWFDDLGALISTSSSTGYTQSSSTTARIASPAAVAPAGATHVRVAVTTTGNSQQLTAALVEQASSVGTYFDGDDTGSGAAWAGAVGASPSVIGTNAAAITASYDDRLGRVRLAGGGLSTFAGRARLLRRSSTGATWAAIRGQVNVSGGTLLRTADDYEFPTDQALVYRAEGLLGAGPIPLADLGAVEVVALPDFGEAFIAPPLARGWLKFMAAPYLNRKITLTDWSDIERDDRNAVYPVRNRPEPVVVTAGHGSRTTTIEVRTWTVEESEALDESLRQGIPGYLHLPASTPLPSMYVVFGRYRRRRPARRSQGSVFSIPLIEVAPPPSSIYGAGATCASVLAQHATCAALLASATTWQEVQ